MGMELRDYQLEAIQKFNEARDSGPENRFLLTCATGGGKTIIVSALMQQEVRQRNGRCLFLCHRDELVRQTIDKLQRVDSSLRIGVIQGRRDDWVDADVVVASVQTISGKKRLPRYPRDAFSLVVTDEAHRVCARTYGDVLHHFKVFDKEHPTTTLGITATPERNDGAKLSEIYQRHIFHIGILELVEKKMLVPIRCLRISTHANLNAARKSMGDFSERDLSALLNTSNRNSLIAEAVKKYAANRNTVAFCVDVQHAVDLAATLRQHGIEAEAVHGKLTDAERRQRLEDFEAGKLHVLTTCLLLVEGWDCPRVDCVLFANKTMSPIRFLQSLGRGTRLSPETGKVDLLVLDCADTAGRHARSIQSVPKIFCLGEAGERALKDGKTISEAKAADEEAERQEAERRRKRDEEAKKKLAVGHGIQARAVDLFAAEAVPSVTSFSKYPWLEVNPDRFFTPLYDCQVHIFRSTSNPDEWVAEAVNNQNFKRIKFLGGGSMTNAFEAAESYLQRHYKWMLAEYRKMATQVPSEKQKIALREAGNSTGSKLAAWKLIALRMAKAHYGRKHTA